MRIFLGSAIVLLLITPVRAGSGWETGRDDDTCYAAMEFEGDGATKLLILGTGDQEPMIHITNYSWSAKKGSMYTLQYHMGEYYYEIPSAGIEDSIRKGFVTYLSDNFLTDFATSASLKISMDGNLVDHLNLAGSGVAVAKFRSCIRTRKLEIAKAKADEERLKHIPKDPFAESE